MTFKLALLVTLGLLALPALGVVITLVREDGPKESVARSAALPPAPEAEKQTSARPPESKASPRQEEAPPRKSKNKIDISGGSAEGAGFRGKLSWFADSGGATIKNSCAFSACLKGDEEKACAKGTVQGTKKGARTKNWGAALAWTLNEDNRGIHPVGKTATKGLSFTFESKVKNVDYLFGVRVGDVDYCTPIKAGANRIAWKHLKKSCTEGNVKGNRDLGQLVSSATALRWYAKPAHKAERKFEFCVADLKAF